MDLEKEREWILAELSKLTEEENELQILLEEVKAKKYEMVHLFTEVSNKIDEKEHIERIREYERSV